MPDEDLRALERAAAADPAAWARLRAERARREKFERTVMLDPAYDRRAEGGDQHVATLHWVLRGALGAVVFTVFTGWEFPPLPPAGVDELWDLVRPGYFRPLPVGVSLHTFDQHPRAGGKAPCRWLGDALASCVVESALEAQRIFNQTVRGGDAALWKRLEDEYEAEIESREKGDADAQEA